MVTAALMQSGGAGIFGDFLFSEVSRGGNSVGGVLSGPVGSDLENIGNIYSRWIKELNGEIKKDVWPDIAQFLVNHVPGKNLPYIKSIMDYALWFHIYETLHPGWWRRYNERMKKEQGRTQMGYQPGRPIPYVPPLLQSAAH